MKSEEVSFTTPDGLALGGTLAVPAAEPASVIVLVPGGGGVDRAEHGFFGYLACQLAEAGVASLRVDHRGYVATVDAEVEVTISGLANDIVAAVRAAEGIASNVHVLTASLTAGASVIASWSPFFRNVSSIVWLYPLLDYRAQLLQRNDLMDSNGMLTQKCQAALARHDPPVHRGYLPLSRCLINEALNWNAEALMLTLRHPVLALHGQLDPVIPFRTTQLLAARSPLVELRDLPGGEHGFGKQGVGTAEGDKAGSDVLANLLGWIRR